MSKVRAAPLVVTVQLGISGSIHLPHPAFADLGGDGVGTEGSAWAERRGQGPLEYSPAWLSHTSVSSTVLPTRHCPDPRGKSDLSASSRLLKNTRIGLFSWPSCVSRPPPTTVRTGTRCPDAGASDTRGRRSGTPRLQIPQPDQVIGGGGEGELPIHQGDAAMPELAQAADGLHPAEDLFHEFSCPLTHVIARMPRPDAGASDTRGRVRPAIALPRTFCATWGVTSWTRTSATKRATS